LCGFVFTEASFGIADLFIGAGDTGTEWYALSLFVAFLAFWAVALEDTGVLSLIADMTSGAVAIFEASYTFARDALATGSCGWAMCVFDTSADFALIVASQAAIAIHKGITGGSQCAGRRLRCIGWIGI
jgi:hypothetical protein